MRSRASLYLWFALLTLSTAALGASACGDLTEGTGLLNVAYTPDGRLVAFTADATHLFDTQLNGELRRAETPWEGRSGATGAVLSADGTTFALSAGKAVDVYDLESGVRRAHIVAYEAREETAPIAGVALSADGAFVAVSVSPVYLGAPRLAVWRVADQALVADIQQPAGRQYWTWGDGVALSAAGDVLYALDTNFYATAPAVSWLTAWTVNGGTPKWERELSHDPTKEFSGFASVLALSPDGTTLATAGSELLRWDAATSEPIPTTASAPSGQSSIAFSPDGRELVTTGGDNTLPDPQIYGPDGSLIRNWANDGSRVCSGAVFSPDGTRVAAACKRRLKVFNVTTGALVHDRKVAGRIY